jgi:hypothetical protein
MRLIQRSPLIAASLAWVLSGCSNGAKSPTAAAPAKSLTCDGSIKTAFKPDALTSVILVKAFKKGDPLALSEPVTEVTPKAANDLCLVKLNVGPGNPGPENVPSTSKGIGIEIWLPSPANWDSRLHALGGGGWVGGPAGSPTAIAEPRAAAVAGNEGAVSSVTDTGHPREGAMPGRPSSGGDFAMNPDGTTNQALWKDFASRSLHEQAVNTKALATIYYGRVPKFSYFEGASNGGREAYSLAQNYPADYDGISGSLPAINWSSFGTADLYPQIVFQRDLGGTPPTEAQQDLVSNAAIHACDVVGGQHLGYIMDIASCRYDPTKDPNVLCKLDGGKNATPDCVTKVRANAINKVWYGMTSDGSVPSPAIDNGWDKELDRVHRWYGLPRGTSLYNAYYTKLYGVNTGLANVTGPFTIASDQVALELQNPAMAAPNFENATGNGVGLWKTLSYVQLSSAFDRGLALQPVFGHVDSNNPDLSSFKARGGKFLGWHGIDDEVIPVQGTMRYYKSVVEKMGTLANVQSFYKLYIVPGVGHVTPNGTSNPGANPPVVPANLFYKLLVNWVENGIAPERIEVRSPSATPVRITQPLCPYPQRAKYRGGDPHVTTSFTCS